MQLNPSEISELIKNKIENLQVASDLRTLLHRNGSRPGRRAGTP